uniref:Uncharacterized protein n=1 Tax=Romanomermis culicivorax TaxID=13658 RepID=A0A915JT56_ROMCU
MCFALRCTHFTWVPEAWTGSPHCWMKHADTEAEVLASHETAKDPKAFCGHLDFLFENDAVSRECNVKATLGDHVFVQDLEEFIL